MKYSIGLDLGVNNVGWAVYDFSKQCIIDKGVVRFESSSDASGRRATRGSRRLNKRRHHRVERLAIFLNSINFNTKRNYEPDLLDKRIKGLTEKLTEEEISNIIYYFAIHRGYIPFDDEKPERAVHKFLENEYPCYYLKSFKDKYGKYRGECDLILLTDNIRELNSILLKQQEFNEKLTNEAINQILSIIKSKREFWQGPGSARENSLTKYGRYKTLADLEKYKKDSNYNKYLYEQLIGNCELSRDRIGNVEKVAPCRNYFAEEFDFYNDFINMSVISPSELESEFRHKVKLNGKFASETIEEFKEYILSKKAVNFDNMLKDICGITSSEIQGCKIDKDGKKLFSKFSFYKLIKNKFSEKKLKPSWLFDEDKAIYNLVVYCLTVSPSAFALDQMIKDRIVGVEFTQEELEILKQIKLKNNKDLKYHSLSESLLKKAIKDMKRAELEYNYSQIMKKLEYDKEMKEYFQNNYSSKTSFPYFVEDKYVDDIIANPQVKKTLRKAIKVINAIIQKYDDYPHSIQIESTKEMNGKDKKKQIEKEQREYENKNKEAHKILESYGYSITPKHITQVINWQETNQKCAYCNEYVPIDKLIESDYEHILPISKTMDSSKENITCSCSKCNALKSNRTPWEFLSSINQYGSFKERVLKEFSISQEKKDNLLFEGDIKKYSIKFINRNLNDNAYGTKALINELRRYNEFLKVKEGYEINILSIPGQLTHRLREKMNIENKDRNYLFHHAVDAMILASIIDTEIGKVLCESQNTSNYWFKHDTDEYHGRVNNMIKSVNLINSNQIKEVHNECDSSNADEKDNSINRSYEIQKNPIRKFSDANYVKFIIGDNNEYYKICTIDNIYNLKINDSKGKEAQDKKLIDKLFDEDNKNEVLLCKTKDTKLFIKLKEIYNHYKYSENPFVEECLNANNLEKEKDKFNYLIHGIRKTEKGPIVKSLRYIVKVTNPYFKKLKQKKNNKHNEFIATSQKENNMIGLTTISQVCTRIFYSYDDKKYIYLPICAISFKNKKLDESDKFYIETYNRLIGNKNVIKIADVYTGDWIRVIKKDGTEQEGRYSYYDKSGNCMVGNLNGNIGNSKRIIISPTIKHIIIYKTDILGNKVIKVDTRKIL